MQHTANSVNLKEGEDAAKGTSVHTENHFEDCQYHLIDYLGQELSLKDMGFCYTLIVAVFLASPPASGEKVEPSPFSMTNSTIPLPVSL